MLQFLEFIMMVFIIIIVPGCVVYLIIYALKEGKKLHDFNQKLYYKDPDDPRMFL